LLTPHFGQKKGLFEVADPEKNLQALLEFLPPAGGLE
jgi:hypothetical protein